MLGSLTECMLHSSGTNASARRAQVWRAGSGMRECRYPARAWVCARARVSLRARACVCAKRTDACTHARTHAHRRLRAQAQTGTGTRTGPGMRCTKWRGRLDFAHTAQSTRERSLSLGGTGAPHCTCRISRSRPPDDRKARTCPQSQPGAAANQRTPSQPTSLTHPTRHSAESLYSYA
jgi:hypothetical protein